MLFICYLLRVTCANEFLHFFPFLNTQNGRQVFEVSAISQSRLIFFVCESVSIEIITSMDLK